MISKKSARPQRRLQDLPIVANDPKTGERLVGLGFRNWMLGYQTGDISCWEAGWNLYAQELGVEKAKSSITELACWARSIHSGTARQIEVYPRACAGFCQDECMAISMVAACQNDACPALKACAFALIGDGALDDVVDNAERFADSLGTNGIILSPGSITNAVASVEATRFSAS